MNPAQAPRRPILPVSALKNLETIKIVLVYPHTPFIHHLPREQQLPSIPGRMEAEKTPAV